MSQSPIAADDAALRSDVRRLGDLLGQTLVRQEGPELLALVEEVRKAVREGSGAEILAQLSVEDSVQVDQKGSLEFNCLCDGEEVEFYGEFVIKWLHKIDKSQHALGVQFTYYNSKCLTILARIVLKQMRQNQMV